MTEKKTGGGQEMMGHYFFSIYRMPRKAAVCSCLVMISGVFAALFSLDVLCLFAVFALLLFFAALVKNRMTRICAGILHILSLFSVILLFSFARRILSTPLVEGFVDGARRFVDGAFYRFLRVSDFDDTAYILGSFMFLGKGSGNTLPDGIRSILSSSGIIHLFCVSGLHLTLTVGLVGKALSAIFSRRIAALLTVAATVLYMTLTGFPLSVVRAGGMMIVYCLARVFTSDGDSLTSLFVSGGIICLVFPGSMIDVGFLLSFFATLGLLVSSRVLSRRSLPERVLSPCVTTLFALSFQFPLYVFYFGGFAFCSVITNFFAALPAVISLTLIVLTVLFCLIGLPIVAAFCGRLGAFFIYILRDIASVFSSLALSVAETVGASLFVFLWLLPFSALLFAIFFNDRRLLLRASYLMTVCFSAFALFRAVVFCLSQIHI